MKTSIASRLLASIGLIAGLGHIPADPGFRGPTRSRRSAFKKTRYVQGLQNHFARKQRDRMQAKKTHPLRDEHGAYTLTGRNTPVVKGVRIGTVQFPARVIGWTEGRRTWLAGISAQRGY